MLRRFMMTLVLLAGGVSSTIGLADAFVVTQAMHATTVAEIFVEPGGVRVELDVGAADLGAFASLVPAALRVAVRGHPAEALGQRSEPLDAPWRLEADGRPLAGRVTHLGLARRLVRDEVTGQPLSAQPPGSEAVVRATLSYPFDVRPASLTVVPPLIGDTSSASIGFVCYHDGIPVNDFRYLAEAATLDLDWDDPWYSRFRHPNLRRQFDAPMSAYLYVEPYEVRKEIVLRPRDLEAWIDLQLPADGVISVAAQDQLKQRVAEFLAGRNPLTIDGQPVEGRLDRINFLHRTLRATGVIEPPVDLPVDSATLGVVFVYPIDRLPQEVAMTWQLFSPRIPSIPAVTADEAGGLPSTVTRDSPVLVWRNHLTQPSEHGMVHVPSPPRPPRLSLPIPAVVCGGGAVGLLATGWFGWLRGRPHRRWVLGAMAVAALAAVLATSAARLAITAPRVATESVSDEAVAEILAGLLHNVYRSFDHHDEQLIYDRLATSIAGDLLAEVYLETRRSMEVKNQGGMRVSVKEIDVTEIERLTTSPEGIELRCRWQVSGWIGHWGHIHRRENMHVADVTIAPREGVWKMTAMELHDRQAESL